MSNEKTGATRLPARSLVGIVAWIGYLFLLLPILVVIPVSFSGSQEFEFPPRHLSLDLYRHFFSDPSWWSSLLHSLVVAVGTLVLSLCLAIPAAYGLSRGQFAGRRMLNVALLSPMLVPVIVLGLGMYLDFAHLGLVNTVPGVILAHTVLASPFAVVSLQAGLRHVDRSLESAAAIMGARPLRVFFRVVLPQIHPALAVAALFAFLLSFDEVVVAYFITGPETTTLPVKMYSAIRWEISPVIAAVSTMLTAVSLIFSVGIMSLQRAEPTKESVDDATSRA